MKLEKNLDPCLLQAELKRASMHLWGISTGRTRFISHHQHTHSILLRNLPEPSTEYKPIYGVHESTLTDIAKWFPLITNTIEKFADEKRLALGRVVIVRLQPGQQSYRHYDSEKHLRNRNRYHLVIDCGENNLLSSGDDDVIARAGDIWFFDNKAMHRAHNNSNKPRTHVIFDGYPLALIQKGNRH